MDKVKNSVLLGTLVSATAAMASDQNFMQERLFQGVPVVVLPSMEYQHPLLNYGVVSKYLRDQVELRADEEIIVRYHAEKQMVDLSTFDAVSITVPLSEVDRAAPNWGMPD